MTSPLAPSQLHGTGQITDALPDRGVAISERLDLLASIGFRGMVNK